MPGLLDRSRRPRNSPTRLSAEIEAEICELRRRHPRWGARRISHELSGRGLESAPSRATVHRVLSRNGLVRAQEQQHPRTYRRRQRETPTHLWQMDLAGRRQLLGSSTAAGDTAENSSDVPRSVRRSAHTTVSVEHADHQSASRTRRPHHPAPPAVLEDLRKAGAAKAEGAPPLSQAQVDRIVAILRQAGSQASARRGAPHRTAGGRGSGTRNRRHGVRSRSSRVHAHPVPQREPAGLVFPDRDRYGLLDRDGTGDAGDRRMRAHRRCATLRNAPTSSRSGGSCAPAPGRPCAPGRRTRCARCPSQSVCAATAHGSRRHAR